MRETTRERERTNERARKSVREPSREGGSNKRGVKERQLQVTERVRQTSERDE